MYVLCVTFCTYDTHTTHARTYRYAPPLLSRKEIDILLNAFAQYEDGPVLYKDFCKFIESLRCEELRLRRRRYKDRCDVARTLLDEMTENDENDQTQERRFDS